MKKIVIMAATAVMMSGCVTTMTAAPVGNYAVESGAIVQLSQNWTHIPSNLQSTEGAVLTKDGMSLNRVHILTVEDGESIVSQSYDKSQEYPLFQAGSSELKQIEFLMSSLARTGLENITPRNVRPVTLSGLSGVQLDIDGKYSTGLNMKGKAALAESDAGLNLIVYIAPAAHYFDKDEAEVDQMIATANFQPVN